MFFIYGCPGHQNKRRSLSRQWISYQIHSFPFDRPKIFPQDYIKHKKYTQEGADIYITTGYTSYSSNMLDIDNLFEKIKTPIQSFPISPSSYITGENPHYSLCSSSSDVYCLPPPYDFTTKLLEYIKDLYDAYPAGDLLYSVPDTLLSLQENFNISAFYYQHSVPNPDRLLLHRADYNITSNTNKIMSHSQNIKA